MANPTDKVVIPLVYNVVTFIYIFYIRFFILIFFIAFVVTPPFLTSLSPS